MAELICKICGGRLVAKNGGIIECADCGMQYEESYVREIAAENAETEKAASGQKKRKAGKLLKILLPLAAVILIAVVLIGMVSKSNAYQEAVALLNDKQYAAAAEGFAGLGNYKDSIALQEKAARLAQMQQQYEKAIALVKEENYEEAVRIFTELGDYEDSEAQLSSARTLYHYNEALRLLQNIDSDSIAQAARLLQELGDFRDAGDLLGQIHSRLTGEQLNGETHTQYQYDSNGRITQKATPDLITGYLYNSAGKLIEESELFLDRGANGQIILDRDALVWVTTYTYNQSGNLVKKHAPHLYSNDLNRFFYFDSRYLENGLFSGNDYWNLKYQYDDNGIVQSFTATRSGKTFTQEIAALGDYAQVKVMDDRVGSVSLTLLRDNGTHADIYELKFKNRKDILLIHTEIQEYDAQGNLTKRTRLDDAGNAENTWEYDNTYDALGKLARQVSRNTGTGEESTRDYIYEYTYVPDAD